MTDQIYYSNWNEKLESGHENYWEDISEISSMIGNDLIRPYQMNYHIDDGKEYLRQGTSIAVLQTKEKFGEVRVYCRLGCHSIISKKYSDHVMSIAEQNNQWSEFMRFDKKPKSYSKWWENRMRDSYPLEPKDKDDYFSKEAEKDVLHYRNTYLKYFRMFPQYKYAIKSGADYPEYILDDKEEAKEYVNNMFHSFEKNKEELCWDDEFCKKRLLVLNERKKIINTIYKIE